VDLSGGQLMQLLTISAIANILSVHVYALPCSGLSCVLGFCTEVDPRQGKWLLIDAQPFSSYIGYMAEAGKHVEGNY